MKVAEVCYVGPMRSHIRHGPSGERYHFKNPMGGDARPLAVSSVRDAKALAENDVFEVEWMPAGELASTVGGAAKSAGKALKDMTYRQKQKLVSSLDADVKGNAPESELEAALEPMVEELLVEMENQR